MRVGALVAVTVAVLGSASAAVIEQRQNGQTCPCPSINGRYPSDLRGVNIAQDELKYTCLYDANRICTWAKVRGF
jgi:hypothetical protein